MKTIFTVLLMAGISLSAQAASKAKERVPASSSSSLETIKSYYGPGKFIEVERIYIGSGKYQVLVTGAAQDKKEEPGPLLVGGIANGDFYTVIQELCGVTTVQTAHASESDRRFYCVSK
ncbi:MAG: hypothetical protein ACXWQO_00085 [Bdellovibrionota bacterium]